MCLGAVYWARPSRVLYGCTHADAAAIGFDDRFIYDELAKSIPERSIPTFLFLREEALAAFAKWANKIDKVEY